MLDVFVGLLSELYLFWLGRTIAEAEGKVWIQ